MLVLHLNLFQHGERFQIITLLFKRNIELKTIHFEYEFDHDDDQNRINCKMSNKKQLENATFGLAFPKPGNFSGQNCLQLFWQPS